MIGAINFVIQRMMKWPILSTLLILRLLLMISHLDFHSNAKLESIRFKCYHSDAITPQVWDFLELVKCGEEIWVPWLVGVSVVLERLFDYTRASNDEECQRWFDIYNLGMVC